MNVVISTRVSLREPSLAPHSKTRFKVSLSHPLGLCPCLGCTYVEPLTQLLATRNKKPRSGHCRGPVLIPKTEQVSQSSPRHGKKETNDFYLPPWPCLSSSWALASRPVHTSVLDHLAHPRRPTGENCRSHHSAVASHVPQGKSQSPHNGLRP